MGFGKKIIVLTLVLVLLVGICAITIFSGLGKPLDKDNTQTIAVTISQGYGTAQIGAVLEENGLIASASKFKLWSRIKGYDSKYKAGTYNLSPSMDFQTIADIIVSGKVVTKQFTVPEGLTIYQTAEVLAKQGMGDYDTFVELIENGNWDYEFLKEAQSGKNHLEGFLYPNTYIVDEGISEEEVIHVMLRQFKKDVYDKALNTLTSSDAISKIGAFVNSENGTSIYQILKVASIIERECAVAEERPLVGSVIYNRLEKGMPLQMCSTVQYALGKQKEVLTYADTKIDSPYNTYINEGLPPGPICSPGIDSIMGAMYPKDTDYLYFVLSEKLDGTSNFSATYDKFNKDKAAYDRAYRAAH